MRKKIILTAILIVLSIISVCIINVSATNNVYSGKCGDNLTWTLDDNGKLIISGTGAMYSYVYNGENASPWRRNGSDVNIKEVVIKESVTSIGNCAFYACSGLTNVTIEDDVTTIGYSAFYGCTSLETINIGKSVSAIYSNAFYNCNGLSRVNISNVGSWCNITFETLYSNPLYYAKKIYHNDELITDVIITKGAEKISAYAFYGYTSLISITMPESVTYIGEQAFYNCNNLANVEMSDNISSIGEEAFYNCNSLMEISIPSAVTSINDFAFYNCTGLSKVNISNIGSWCSITFSHHSSNPLYWAKNLYINNVLATDVVIADGVTTISDYAFYGCTSLVSVNIPESVLSIGYDAFYNCDNLTSINIPEKIESIAAGTFYGCSNLIEIEIPDSVIEIGYEAFCWCSNLTDLTIGIGLTSVDNGAFRYCFGLTKINWNARYVENFAGRGVFDGVGRDGTGAIVVFGEEVKNIPANLFNAVNSASQITNILIGSNVETIGDFAFANTNITDIILPDSVETIGNAVFQNCSELETVLLSKGIKNITENTFDSCSALKYIGIPVSATSIKTDAFYGCTNLEMCFYEGSEQQYNNILIYKGNEILNNTKNVYNATKKTYKFETNCNVKINDITNYAIFSSPIVKNEGKNFIGWYDNSSLSGEPVRFPYYGSATTLYAAWTDRTGKSFDDALVAKENQQYTVTTTESGQIIYYEFVPKYTGEYRFYSIGNYDTYGYLYNSSRNPITYNDDAGDGNNFHIAYELTAGEIYYIGAKVYSGTGTFILYVETDCVPGTKTVCVTASSGEKIFISIPSYLPENSQVILACYKNDKFVEMETAPNKNETIYFVINHEFDTAKVMVWESFENMKPLCEVETVQ